MKPRARNWPIARARGTAVLSNAQLAELLALEAEKESHFVAKAFRKASRLAFTWPEEVTAMIKEERSLIELAGIGPYLAKRIEEWIENPPKIPDSPPIRSSFLTMSEAKKIIAQKRAWASRYKGDLQMHTVWSDGSATIMEMAEAAMARRYEYIAITDHSKGLKIAGGIDETKLRAQGKEIVTVNAKLSRARKNFRVLRSIELNLNPQGQGDMDPQALAELDLVVGSFHSALRKKEDQTERYLTALRNSSVDILGHPRGRIYNYRLGLEADWGRVFAVAAEQDKAVEVDSYADRQDLDLELLELARRAGVRIAIDTDAHHPHQLNFAILGLAAAIRARIPAERIVNFMQADELIEWVAARRAKATVIDLRSV